jgi:D-glycero-alpha-D-manno-heptose-7-phosphate kinase
MIISRTPLRISFCGGGSDLASFYEYQQGAVVSTTINKFIYINVNKKFDHLIRASYSITEFAERPQDLKHELIREALLMLNLDGGIEITSISDIPSSGTGLGSSSTYTVGLLNALHAYKGEFVSKERLAKEACKIEIESCSKPIGKQDQYAASYGNLNYLQFNSDGTVFVDPIVCSRNTIIKIKENLLMLYTGLTRSSEKILEVQNSETKKSSDKRKILRQMVQLAGELKNSLEKGDHNNFGHLLDQNWELKKRLATGISDERIDKWYQKAKEKGALGGKILGAGGGGFLLLFAPKQKHKAILSSLPELKPTNFDFENEGSKIIYYGDK